MDKFVAFMEKHFIPVASKIGAQRNCRIFFEESEQARRDLLFGIHLW